MKTTTTDKFGFAPGQVISDKEAREILNKHGIKLDGKKMKVMALLCKINGINKKEDGDWFYITNSFLMEHAGIGSKHTLTDALKFLEDNNYIERVPGETTKQHPAGKASRYRITTNSRGAVRGAVMGGTRGAVTLIEKVIKLTEASVFTEAESDLLITTLKDAVSGGQCTRERETYNISTEDYSTYHLSSYHSKVKNLNDNDINNQSTLGCNYATSSSCLEGHVGSAIAPDTSHREEYKTPSVPNGGKTGISLPLGGYAYSSFPIEGVTEEEAEQVMYFSCPNEDLNTSVLKGSSMTEGQSSPVVKGEASHKASIPLPPSSRRQQFADSICNQWEALMNALTSGKMTDKKFTSEAKKLSSKILNQADAYVRSLVTKRHPGMHSKLCGICGKDFMDSKTLEGVKYQYQILSNTTGERHYLDIN